MLQSISWIIVSLIIHEAGHAIAVILTGGKINAVGASLRGFYIRHTDSGPTRNMIVALAGPGANLLTYVVLVALGNPYSWISLWFGVFNLMPFPHSDMIHAILYYRASKVVTA